MNQEPRDYIKEVEGMLSIPRPLPELLAEDRVATMEKLFAFLNIENVMQRKSVAYALGQIGDPWAIEQLELRLKVETVEGVSDAIKASLAALKKMPADKGFSDLERRQYIADVYWGKADNKIDVNEWQWKSQEADEIYSEGAREVIKATMLRKMKGMENPAVRNEIKGYLEKGIPLINKALSIEQPPHPLSYQRLTIAFVELGMLNYYATENAAGISAEIKSLFDEAKMHAGKASESYEQSTGWNEGGRYDFHAAMAMAYFLTNEYNKAQEELDKAKQFNSETAYYTNEVAFVENGLEKIKKAGIGKREIREPQETKGGCFGIVVTIISLILVLIFLLIIALN